jgi:hypothetical protein
MRREAEAGLETEQYDNKGLSDCTFCLQRAETPRLGANQKPGKPAVLPKII